MTTYGNGYALGQYFARMITNGRYHVLDNYCNQYSVIGTKYEANGDRVYLEINPDAYCEHREYGLHDTCRFSIKPTKIIFNGPATIVFWDDGTKTVVKCTEREPFDCEKGVALCYMKKLLGNDNSFHHIFKKFIPNSTLDKLNEKHMPSFVVDSTTSINKTFNIIERINRNAKRK